MVKVTLFESTLGEWPINPGCCGIRQIVVVEIVAARRLAVIIKAAQ